MKRQISSLLIASTVLTGSAFTPVALNEVSAKTIQQQQKVEKATIIVDGKAKAISSTIWNKHKLYSAEQLSKLLSATIKYNEKTKSYVVAKKVNNKTVKAEYKVNVGNVVINGKKTKVSVAPKLVEKKLFVEAESFIKALGGDFLGGFLSTAGLVSGDTFDPQWVNNSTILVTNEDGQDSRTLLLNITTKKVVSTVNATDLVVSPNGKQAIYADDNGVAILVDLISKKAMKLNEEENDTKSDFVWSKDGQTVYFLTGEKLDVVASMNVADGQLTKIVSDKVNYKSDLHLSVDGKKLLYVVAKEGVTNKDANGEVESIDMTGTEPQIYAVNLTDATPAGVAVTTTTDNKVLPGYISNGNIVYLSADAESDDLPVLNMIDQNNEVTTLISNKDIVSSLVTPNGEVMILVADSKGYSVIYKVNPDTKKLTKVAQTKLKLNSFSISNDGKSVAATTSGVNGDAVVVLKNGSFELLTK